MSTAIAGPREYRAPSFWQSTNGKKAVMAVTGAMMFVFVIGHMLGNLQIFESREHINAYGHFLHNLGELLWIARGGLIALRGAAHFGHRSAGAPQPEGPPHRLQGEEVRRLLLRLPHHVLERPHRSGLHHLPPAPVHRRHAPSRRAAFSEGDVYHNVVSGFQVWWVSAWYIFSMILLGLHLQPRHLEHVPVARPRPSAPHARTQTSRALPSRSSSPSATFPFRSACSLGGAIK